MYLICACFFACRSFTFFEDAAVLLSTYSVLGCFWKFFFFSFVASNDCLYLLFFKMILCTIYDEIAKFFTIFCFVAVCTLTLSPLISFLLQIMLPINLMYVSPFPIIWIIVSLWHLFLALNTK